MCNWFLNHGRCGEDFPKLRREYLFIPDEATDDPYSKLEKKRCLERSASPKQSRTMTFYGDSFNDYY